MPALEPVPQTPLRDDPQQDSIWKRWLEKVVSNTNDSVTVAEGGTGITSYTVGDMVYASGTTTLSKLADVATGNVILSGGVGVAPAYGKVGLTTHVSGRLPLANMAGIAYYAAVHG